MKRHDFEAVPFVAGALGVAIAAGVFLGETTALRLRVEWLLPIALVVTGIGGIVHVLRHERNGDGPDGEAPGV